MHRIDGPGATVDNEFTEGNPATAVPATEVTADWLNDVQEELMSILAAASIAPVKGDQDQVLTAINQLIAASAIDMLNTTRIDVASASTVNLTTAAPNTRHINITGTTAITGFTIEAGRCYFVRFAGALTLTNSASLVTQTGANITTTAGDTCIIRATAADVVEVLCFTRAKQFYESPEQIITAGGALSLTHNLGGAPRAISAFLVCKTAEAGYSVGETVPVPVTATDASAAYGLSAVLGTTTISLRYGAGSGAFILLNHTSGVIANITPSNWRMIVRAER